MAARGARAAGRAQVARIGVLNTGLDDAVSGGLGYRAFVAELQKLGFAEGRNLIIDYGRTDLGADKAFADAAAMVRSNVAVIVASGSELPLQAAVAASSSIPIVMLANNYDPIARGYVTSLARPGGNVTGFSSAQMDIEGKGLEIFKDMVPGLARVAVLVPRIARNLFAPTQEAAAKALGIDLLYIDLPGPEAAGTAMRQAVSTGAQGALMRAGPFFSSSQRQAIVDLAAELRLPVMYERREYIEQGGLLTYVPDIADLYRRAAGYVVAILAGANPGDLPIEQPTKFELVLNLKTAKALGIEVPHALQLLADEVIE